jgi:hypothetical protein
MALGSDQKANEGTKTTVVCGVLGGVKRERGEH